jgi:hypothetical protein
MRVEGLGKLKRKINDLIGNQTHDLIDLIEFMFVLMPETSFLTVSAVSRYLDTVPFQDIYSKYEMKYDLIITVYFNRVSIYEQEPG